MSRLSDGAATVAERSHELSKMSMLEIKEVLRGKEAGDSARKLAREMGLDREPVGLYLATAETEPRLSSIPSKSPKNRSTLRLLAHAIGPRAQRHKCGQAGAEAACPHPGRQLSSSPGAAVVTAQSVHSTIGDLSRKGRHLDDLVTSGLGVDTVQRPMAFLAGRRQLGVNLGHLVGSEQSAMVPRGVPFEPHACVDAWQAWGRAGLWGWALGGRKVASQHDLKLGNAGVGSVQLLGQLLDLLLQLSNQQVFGVVCAHSLRCVTRPRFVMRADPLGSMNAYPVRFQAATM